MNEALRFRELLLRHMAGTCELACHGCHAQQERGVWRLREAESRRIPAEFLFSAVPGLSRDVRDKRERVLPAALGQASGIPGVTPAVFAVLDVYLNLTHYGA